MVPMGSSNPLGRPQSVPTSTLLSNSSLMGGNQSNSIHSQPPFSSLVSTRTQFNSNSLLANISNVSSLNRSIQNGNADADLTPLTSSSGAVQGRHFQNPSGSQIGSDRQQSEQIQQQLKGGIGDMGNLRLVKLEQQNGSTDQNGPMQQLQPSRGMGQVKLEQQLQSLRSLGPMRLEPLQSDALVFLQQQQEQQYLYQQQQLMEMARESPQAAAAAAEQMNLLKQHYQQRLLQQQQQKQQQQQQQLILKSLPQQRAQLQQQLHQQSLPGRPPQVKPSAYEPGTCARRLMHYMSHQRHRPDDNNIEFWRKLVAEYFAPNAKKRWCVSLYGSGRQTAAVFRKDAWHCEICNWKPRRGFETTVEVLPRLCQIKYASGTLEELLYVDMPNEYQNDLGQIVLDYAKAVQESVFAQLHIVREGQLRIVFNPDLKIASWEFCARRHEELIPRRLIIPQISQLGAVVHNYQASAQNASSGLSSQDLQNTCSSFVASARQLAKGLEVPLVNDLGYTKRYVRCLQIAEVVNTMKDLIDYSKRTGVGPMDSLINFPKRTSGHQQQSDEQQSTVEDPSNNDQTSAHATGEHQADISNGNSSASTFSSPTLSSSANNLTQVQPDTASAVQQAATESDEADPGDPRSSVQRIIQELMMSSQLDSVGNSGNGTTRTIGITPSLNGVNFSVGNGIYNSTGIGGTGPSVTSVSGTIGRNHISQDPRVLSHREPNFGWGRSSQ